MEQKENEQKPAKSIYSDVFKTILISVITALITQIFAYYFWTRQFDNNKREKLIDYKLSSFDRFSTNAYKACYLSEFASRIKIEQYKAERQLADSIKAITKIQLDTLPASLRYIVHKRLEIKFPLIYSNYMKFLDFQNEYISAAFTASAQFDDSIKQQINDLSSSFLEESLQLKVKEELEKTQIDIYYINQDNIVNAMLKTKYKMLEKILNDMLDEIQKK